MAQEAPHTESRQHELPPPSSAAPGLTREILTLAVVVVIGAIMTVLDDRQRRPADARTRVRNIDRHDPVGRDGLSARLRQRHLTGWASERLGAKELWLLSLALFTAGSLLAGLSWSIGSLIAFRVVQGLGGGMIMPLGQTILAEAAGPQLRSSGRSAAACSSTRSAGAGSSS